MKSFSKTLLLLFLASPFLIFNSFSQQAPGIEWQKTIGGTGNDYLKSIRQTIDGGFIIGGFSESNVSGNKTENSNGADDYWIVKLDSIGNVKWQNTIGGNDVDDLSSIEQTSDGGYILAGTSWSNISGDKSENCLGYSDYWLVKIDSSGAVQWQKTLGGSEYDVLSSAKQTNDGGYILGGYSDSYPNYYNDYWIIKLDSLDSVQWQYTYGSFSNDFLASVSQTSDGGYIMGGYSGYTPDYFIIKTHASTQWQKTIGGSNNDYLSSIEQTSDGGYILAGHSNSGYSGDKTESCLGGEDYWIVKLDNWGNIQWQNTIGGNSDDQIFSLRQTQDNGYILGGSSLSGISGDKTENNIGGADYWIIKLDSTGNIQWQNTIGGNYPDILNSIFQTMDGGYILGGYSISNISGDKTENCIGDYDYWIIKLSPDTITSIHTINQQSSTFTISPNPSNGIFQITFSSSTQKTNYTLKVINTLGQTVFQSSPDSYRDNNHLPIAVGTSINLDLSFLPKGIYFLKVISEKQILTSKFVKE